MDAPLLGALYPPCPVATPRMWSSLFPAFLGVTGPSRGCCHSPAWGQGAHRENTGVGFEGGQRRLDWTSGKVGSTWAQRVVRPGRPGHTGKWTVGSCTATHRGVTGAHGVSSCGRAGASLIVSWGSPSCTVPMAAFPPGRLTSSHSGSWHPLTQELPLCSSGPGPALLGGSFSCSGSPTSPPASSSVWGPRVMTGLHPDNPEHTPHLDVSSSVTNNSKVPHRSAQVSV